jgi:uncharacterized protein YjbJ (UPF0337 family)
MSGTGKQAGGALEYLKGKMQRIVGGMTGDKSMRARGMGHQAKGGAKYETGKVQNKVDDALDRH